MANKSTLTLQKWGNSLAVRIPASLAQRAHFVVGSHVELSVKAGELTVRSAKKMTLNERLDKFDAKKHGGEVMADEPVGLEKFK